MRSITEQLESIRKMTNPFEIHRGDPFQVLIKTILSHRTKDENTDKAADALFAKYPNAKTLKQAPIEDVERLIRPTGFYRVKATRVKEVARIIDEVYCGIVPAAKSELMLLPGVGPKTANCVLVYAYGKLAIPVDTHVHRISNRLGWVKTKTPEETEVELLEIVPEENWISLNELLVNFGKEVCKPISPLCNICILSGECSYFINKCSRIKEIPLDKKQNLNQ